VRRIVSILLILFLYLIFSIFTLFYIIRSGWRTGFVSKAEPVNPGPGSWEPMYHGKASSLQVVQCDNVPLAAF
jgi:hypothetical protein